MREWFPIIDRLQALTRHLPERKINIAGGEPLCYPGLIPLLRYSKQAGFITTIITNGLSLSDLTIPGFVDCVDYIGISIDSARERTNRRLGRASKRRTPSGDFYHSLATELHKYGIPVKVNTVVSRFTVQEDLIPLMQDLQPLRWKILQFTENRATPEKFRKRLSISTDAFKHYCDKVRAADLPVVCEDREMVRSSYLLVGPDGSAIGCRDDSYQVQPISWEQISSLSELEQFFPQFRPDSFRKRQG